MSVQEVAPDVDLDRLLAGAQFIDAYRIAVEGTALDFCLVVTQRRHHRDTALSVQGPLAVQWLDIAQAFAGPPAGGAPGHCVGSVDPGQMSSG